MCLLLAAYRSCPGFRLVIAANRDEYHARPTDAARFWHDYPHVLGGRDAEANGTWLALDRAGRLATITNVPRGLDVGPSPRSRGLLVTDFLNSNSTAPDHLESVARHGQQYQGFNLLAYDGSALCWYSNEAAVSQTLAAGTYTLSNASLHTPWPKTERLRTEFEALTLSNRDDTVDALLDVLSDRSSASAQASGDLREAIFIRGEHYGTRCSSVILIDDNGLLTFHERSYDRSATTTGDTRFSFELDPEPS